MQSAFSYSNQVHHALRRAFRIMTPFIVIGAIAVLLVPVGVGAQVGTTSITTVPTTTVDILPQTGDEATTTAPTTRSTFWAILIAIIVLILVVWFVMRAR